MSPSFRQNSTCLQIQLFHFMGRKSTSPVAVLFFVSAMLMTAIVKGSASFFPIYILYEKRGPKYFVVENYVYKKSNAETFVHVLGLAEIFRH